MQISLQAQRVFLCFTTHLHTDTRGNFQLHYAISCFPWKKSQIYLRHYWNFIFILV